MSVLVLPATETDTAVLGSVHALSYLCGGVALTLPLAAFIGATSWTALNTGLLPRWLAWVGMLAGAEGVVYWATVTGQRGEWSPSGVFVIAAVVPLPRIAVVSAVLAHEAWGVRRGWPPDSRMLDRGSIAVSRDRSSGFAAAHWPPVPESQQVGPLTFSPIAGSGTSGNAGCCRDACQNAAAWEPNSAFLSWVSSYRRLRSYLQVCPSPLSGSGWSRIGRLRVDMAPWMSSARRRDPSDGSPLRSRSSRPRIPPDGQP
jgi:hypothetical protein